MKVEGFKVQVIDFFLRTCYDDCAILYKGNFLKRFFLCGDHLCFIMPIAVIFLEAVNRCLELVARLAQEAG